MYRIEVNLKSRVINISKHITTPLYLQIYQQVRNQIVSGSRSPGSRLPSSRSLAEQCGVARETVNEAYAQLKAEGYVMSRPGSGTYVMNVGQSKPLPGEENGRYSVTPRLSTWGQQIVTTRSDIPPPTAAYPIEIDFGFGRAFPHHFPYDIWRRLLARYLSTDDAMLAKVGSVAGYAPLREAIANYLSRQRGVICEPEQIVIISGAQQAVDLLARLMLEPGDPVVMETPGYADAYALFKAHGAQVWAQPVDEHGLPIEQVPTAVSPKLIFVTPTNQFPRGGAMPAQRRLALLAYAQKKRALIIEDDYDGALRYHERPFSALQGLDHQGQVIYLGTFSKVLFPALRLAYVVLPPSLVDPFRKAKRLVDRAAPTLTQAAIADFITEGHFERHLRHLREAYGQQRQWLVDAIRQQLPGDVTFSAEPAGLHIMLLLGNGRSEAHIVEEAAQRGVRVYPGRPYHLREPIPETILLGFSGLDRTAIEEGVRRLSELF